MSYLDRTMPYMNYGTSDITAAKTVDEALTMSGLNWTVSPRPLYNETLEDYDGFSANVRDEDDTLKELNDGEIPYKSFGNKVYAFAIPLVNEEEYSDKISIEHYYHRHDLLKEDQNHRRLFLGEEFDGFLGVSKNKQFITKTNYKNKVPTNGIIDEKVYLVGDEFHTNIALSKNDFAELVLDETYAKDFDFSNFRKIYDKIKMIVDINE